MEKVMNNTEQEYDRSQGYSAEEEKLLAVIEKRLVSEYSKDVQMFADSLVESVETIINDEKLLKTMMERYASDNHTLMGAMLRVKADKWLHSEATKEAEKELAEDLS